MKVTPIYTGGNIYVFLGKTENEYFMADSCNFDVTLFDADPKGKGDAPFLH